MTEVKVIGGIPLADILLQKNQHASFVLDKGGFCELSISEEGVPRIMVDSMRYVVTIREVTGGDD
jgi:hypothetical protein